MPRPCWASYCVLNNEPCKVAPPRSDPLFPEVFRCRRWSGHSNIGSLYKLAYYPHIEKKKKKGFYYIGGTLHKAHMVGYKITG